MNFIRNRAVLLNFLFITAFIALIVFCYFYVDRPIVYFFENLPVSSFMHKTIRFINGMGLGWIYLVGLPIASFVSLKILHKPKIARVFMFLWLCALFSGLCCDILKILLSRARPEELIAFNNYGFLFGPTFDSYYWSFPSGHTTIIASVMVGLSYVKPRYTSVFILIALIISSMRIILFQHYISDVIAGFYLSFICVNLLYAFYLKKSYTLPVY